MLMDVPDTTVAIVAAIGIAGVVAAWWLTAAPGRARRIAYIALMCVVYVLIALGERIANAAARFDEPAL